MCMHDAAQALYNTCVSEAALHFTQESVAWEVHQG